MNALNRAIEAAGGLTKLADLIRVQPNQLGNWRSRGVPVEHCAPIELAVTGVVKRWDLRPDDWHTIWPELIGTEGSPPVPEKVGA